MIYSTYKVIQSHNLLVMEFGFAEVFPSRCRHYKVVAPPHLHGGSMDCGRRLRWRAEFTDFSFESFLCVYFNNSFL